MINAVRLVVLGAGTVGRAAIWYAARLAGIQTIYIADRDPAAAEWACADAEGKGIPLTVDATNRADLVRVIERGDVVLNCIGPFFRFGRSILDAAISTHRPYLDICDDPDPTLEMLTLHDKAVTHGVTAVVGQGASPGTANLLAMLVAQAVQDRVDLLTGWSLEDDPGDAGGAANEHWLEQATGRIKLWRGAELVEEKPLRELTVELPGYPTRPALTIGHPEAVTLPRTLTGLRDCLNVMTLPGALADTLRRAARAVDAEGLSLMDASRRELSRHVPGNGPELPVYPGVWALALGPSGRAGAYLPDYGSMTDMATTTAAPLIAGLDLVLAGKARGPGVLAPEQAFDPADYFPVLGRVAGIAGEPVRLVTT